jgi:hypothetical protein
MANNSANIKNNDDAPLTLTHWTLKRQEMWRCQSKWCIYAMYTVTYKYIYCSQCHELFANKTLMIVKQRTFLYVSCNLIISIYGPSENDMRWLLGTTEIIIHSPYDFFFFSLQQHLKSEYYLLVQCK